MYGCESWTIKKAECWRIDAFELWCWRRLLRVPWAARRSNQSILKEISPGCSFVGLILKLKLQYSGYLMRRADSFEKTLMLERLRAGGEGDNRGWDGWMASLTQWTWVWVDSGSWWWTGRPGVLPSIGAVSNMTERLNWTELSSLQGKFREGRIFFFSILLEVTLQSLSKSCFNDWKDTDAGKDLGQEEKGMTEDEMAGWHHWLNGHGFG